MTKKELKYINSLKEENERIKNILICFMEALGKVRNVDDIDSISLIPLMSELNKGIRAEIKAEAYKEFAQKLESIIMWSPKNHISITAKDVREILNGLVGE